MTSSAFQSRYQKLNEQQKQAVDAIFGPVMVIAGPGTGKTEILAARIANILQNPNSGAQAHNILCLTYTEAGTVAMRKRLLQFIGASAYKVAIHTFHSFCNEVIQQNLDYFGVRDLQAASDLERAQVIEKIIDDFPVSHPLFRKSGYYELTRLQSLFDVMKAENWDTKTVCEAVDTYVSELPNREEFQYKRANKTKNIQAGDANDRLINAELEKMEKLKAGAQEFEKYQTLLLESGRYDFQDMISWTLKAFSENENILARYQEQFQYLLVDEFQDTNGSQNQLLQQLTSFWDEPNLFIVGDDDQSIYRFQGANLRNIMEFYQQHKESIQTVVLTQNYRSSQKILNAADELISANQERLVEEIPNLTKKLEAANTQLANSSVKPQITEYFNTLHEEAGIVEQIENLQKQGVNLSEVAVLYNKHRQAANILKALELKGIPFNVKVASDILELPFTHKILQILEFIQKESEKPGSANALLFQILHYDFFELKASEIAEMLVSWKTHNKEASSVIPGSDPESILMENQNRGLPPADINWIPDQVRDDKNKVQNNKYESFLAYLQTSPLPQFQTISETLYSLIQESFNKTFQEFIEHLVNKTGILSQALKSDDQAYLLKVLTTFFNFIKEEAKKDPKIHIASFLEIIKQMQTHSIRLPIQKTNFAEKGVHFITAHSSKGLEFQHVFVIGCNKKEWDSSRGNMGNFSFPDTLTRANEGSFLEESRRLFFVAITRAKEFLHLSYAAQNENGKDLEASQFIVEIKEKAEVDFEEYTLSDEKVLAFQGLLMQEKEEKTGRESFLNDDLLDDLLKDYKLSITHLNKYLRCPTALYFENILKVPAAKNEFMSFGTAMHYALEQFFKEVKHSHLSPPDKGDLGGLIDNSASKPLSLPLSGEQTAALKTQNAQTLIFYFEKQMQRERESFTDEQWVKNLAHGKETLKKMYEHYKDEWNWNCLVEHKITQAEIDGVAVTGNLDKIEFLENGTVNVVDYKTGKASNSREKLNPPTQMKEEGGDYWRQAIFYKLLLEADPKHHWNFASAEIDFIEPEKDEFKKVKIQVHSEDEQLVREQIKTVSEAIKKHEFENGCKEETCTWCKFVKENF